MKLTCLTCGQVNRVPEARLAAGPKCGTCGEKLISGRAPEIDAATLDKALGTTSCRSWWTFGRPGAALAG
jgi:thioredoxin 2